MCGNLHRSIDVYKRQILDRALLHWYPDIKVGDKLKLNIHDGDNTFQKEIEVDVYKRQDGPTSIFIAGKLNGDNFIFMIVVGIILLILAGVIFYKRKH